MKASAETQKVREASTRKEQGNESVSVTVGETSSILEIPKPDKKKRKNRRRIKGQLENMKNQFHEKALFGPSSPIALNTPFGTTVTNTIASTSSVESKNSRSRVRVILQELHNPSRASKAVKTLLMELLSILDSRKMQDSELLGREGVIDLLINLGKATADDKNGSIERKLAFHVLDSLCRFTPNASRMVFSLSILDLIDLLASELHEDKEYVPFMIHTIHHSLSRASIPSGIMISKNLERQFKERIAAYIFTSGIIDIMVARMLAIEEIWTSHPQHRTSFSEVWHFWNLLHLCLATQILQYLLHYPTNFCNLISWATPQWNILMSFSESSHCCPTSCYLMDLFDEAKFLRLFRAL